MGEKLIHVLPTDRVHSMQTVAENWNLIFHDEFTYIITGLSFSQIMIEINPGLPPVISTIPENLNGTRVGPASNQHDVILEHVRIELTLVIYEEINLLLHSCHPLSQPYIYIISFFFEFFK